MRVYCAHCGKQIDTDRQKYYSPFGDTKYFCDYYNCYIRYKDKLHKEKFEAQLKSSASKSSGSTYVSAQFTGYKEQKFPDGSLYVGDFVDGKMHGKGKWIDSDGTSYVGDWVNDQRTGKGKYTWDDGTYYEGDFLDGKFHGYGKKTSINGYIYEGEFRNNKCHGKGRRISPSGRVAEYYYENDKRICGASEATDEIINRIYKGGAK